MSLTPMKGHKKIGWLGFIQIKPLSYFSLKSIIFWTNSSVQVMCLILLHLESPVCKSHNLAFCAIMLCSDRDLSLLSLGSK